MAKKTKKPTEQYLSATCGLGNAVTVANEWYSLGYEVVWFFAVVANEEKTLPDGTTKLEPVQAIWLLGKKRG